MGAATMTGRGLRRSAPVLTRITLDHASGRAIVDTLRTGGLGTDLAAYRLETTKRLWECADPDLLGDMASASGHKLTEREAGQSFPELGDLTGPNGRFHYRK